MGDLRFSVIIPVFNKWDLTRGCLESLREHTPGDDFEVIVADNASSDATPAELDKLGAALFGAGRFRSLRFPENRNFGPACNAGAAEAKAPLLLFLNNDTLLTANWAPPLLQALDDDPALGAVGPLLLYADKSVQHLGVSCDTTGLNHLYRGFPSTHPLVRKRRRLQFITAATLLISKALFLEIGAFHAGYRNGCEDVDLCVQITRAGKKLACVPESCVFHLESQSSGRHLSDTQNFYLLQERCGPYIYPDLHRHGARDGFKVVMDDNMGQSLLVSDAQSAELERAAAGKTRGSSGHGPARPGGATPVDSEALFELIRANPYWLQGHTRLAEILKAKKLYSDAAHIYLRVLIFYPHLAAFKQLSVCAELAGDARAKESVEIVRQSMLTPAENLKRLEQSLKIAGNFKDRLLADLLRAKMDEIRASL